MPKNAFAHVETWIFDLDNTLYPAEADLFGQIDKRMTAFIAQELNLPETEADALRRRYWREYGATLKGLMHMHNARPEPFLEHAHDIDLSSVAANPALGAAIDALPGRKIVHTNGPRLHAERVLRKLGLQERFEAIYGIAECAYHSKPNAQAYEIVMRAEGLAPEKSAMIEDAPDNLQTPHAWGMRTVLVPNAPIEGPPPHVHYVAQDLTAFLKRLV